MYRYLMKELLCLMAALALFSVPLLLVAIEGNRQETHVAAVLDDVENGG